jgi:large subunit ribosomal protein L4
VQWEGGGIAHPPIPHSWRQRVPKKVKALARRSALNDRAENDRVVIADLPAGDAPKTRELVGFVKALGAQGKVLILTDGANERLHLSARNVSTLKVVPFGEEAAYDVLWAEIVVIERAALENGADAGTGSEEEDSDA